MVTSESLTFLPSEHEVSAEICRRSFYEFFKEMWGAIVAEEFHDNWHIKYLCDELQKLGERIIAREPKLYDLVINVPPGTSKSTICSQMFPAWMWCRDPRLRFITGSYSSDLALEQADYTRTLITSEKYRLMFPDVELQKDKNMKHNYRLSKRGQRFSTSTGGTITGIHAHCIIIDDPLNPKQAASESELKEANMWMDRTLSTRKVDKALTPTILIMQRLHEDDPSGHFLEKAKRKNGASVKHICIPGSITETSRKNVNPPELIECYSKDGLMDARRMPHSVLDEMRVDLGSYGYAGQIDQKPAPDDGGVWKKKWFGIESWEKFHERKGSDKVVWNCVIDPAYTDRDVNDPSGLMQWCHFENCMYIRACECVWKEQPDLESYIEKFTRLNGYKRRSRVFIEPKANGISTAQGMRRRSRVNIVLLDAPTRDKVSRARDNAPFIESGRVILLGRSDDKWIEDFINEVTTFPNAKHDERVDMLNMGIEKLNTNPDESDVKMGGGAV